MKKVFPITAVALLAIGVWSCKKSDNEFLNVHFKGVYLLTQKSLPILNNGGSSILLLER